MFNKRKRSTRRWSVRAIEMMIVLVAMIATTTVLFPQQQTTEIRIVETVVEAPAQEVLNPDTNDLITASYDAALDYMYAEDFKQSANLLEAITDVAHDHYWSHVTYSFVLYELGDYDEAMKVATEGIEIDPNDAVAWNNRCLLRALTGDLDGALDDCNQSIAVNPNYDYSYNNRCYILTYLARLDEAEKDCMQALENDHRMPEWVYTNLGRIMMARGFDRMAEAYYITALDHNPTHADAYAGLGDVMLVRSNFTESLKLYNAYQATAGVHYNPVFDERIEYVKLMVDMDNN